MCSFQQEMSSMIASFDAMFAQLSSIADMFINALHLILDKENFDPEIPSLYVQLKQIYDEEEQILNRMDQVVQAMFQVPNELITESQQERRKGCICVMNAMWEIHGQHYTLMEENKE